MTYTSTKEIFRLDTCTFTKYRFQVQVYSRLKTGLLPKLLWQEEMVVTCEENQVKDEQEEWGGQETTYILNINIYCRTWRQADQHYQQKHQQVSKNNAIAKSEAVQCVRHI